MPEFSYSLDNAAMIAAAGAFRFEHLSEEERGAAKNTWRTLTADANLSL